MRVIPLTLVALLAAPANAQPQEFALAPRNAAIADPFSDAVGMAEFQDGRVIVSDRTELAYFVVDFRAGTRRRVGQNGAGPHEYQVPFGPIRWKVDTLLGYDPRNNRLLRIGQDGAVLSTIALLPRSTGGVTSWATPRVADVNGGVYWSSPIIEMRPVVTRSMKANIIRWVPGTDSIGVALQIADHAEFEHSWRYRAMPQSDAWVVAPDGRIGVLSAAEYTLTWYKDGKVVETGPRVPYAPVSVTAAEREAFRQRKALEPVAGGASAGGPPNLPRGGIGIERARAAWPDSLFPERMPPFEEDGALLTPGGDIWVKRRVASADPRPRIDILDARGALRGFIRLPVKSRLFGVGMSSVYVIVTDDDGLQTLERYGYPSGLK